VVSARFGFGAEPVA